MTTYEIKELLKSQGYKFNRFFIIETESFRITNSKLGGWNGMELAVFYKASRRMVMFRRLNGQELESIYNELARA